jgi:hypothetical protein
MAGGCQTLADSDACPPAPRQVAELAADVLPVYLLYQSCSAGNFLYKGRMDGCGAAPPRCPRPRRRRRRAALAPPWHAWHPRAVACVGRGRPRLSEARPAGKQMTFAKVSMFAWCVDRHSSLPTIMGRHGFLAWWFVCIVALSLQKQSPNGCTVMQRNDATKP